MGGAGMIGTKLSDRYQISGELGRGGMGVVYRAYDPTLDRDVAVKLIPPTCLNPDAVERFQREARFVAQMDHPGIVPIHDFGQHEDSLFLVMPVVAGTSLRPFLRERSLRLGDVVDIGIQVLDALQYSHTRGVVHRDIKPENIMVSREEAGLRVRLMDFGLAKGSTKTRITQTGVLVGTMAYLSPEQVTARDVDERTDLYAVGTVLYECLVGAPPFHGEVQSILYRVVHEQPQGPRELGLEIDPALEEIVLRCLAKDPGRRPQSAGEVAEALRRYRARLRESERHRSVMLSESQQFQRPAASPFVGREREFAELQQRLNAALAGECQLVLVGGEAGIGKTRLLDEIESLARARRVRVLHGRFVEQDRAFPYQGFCEVIQEYFLQKETGSSSSALPDFSDLAGELVALFPMLSEIPQIGAPSTPEPIPDDRTHIFELLARALARIAGNKPLVLLLRDLHDADVSLEALQYIIRRLGPTPTLIVGTFVTTQLGPRHSVSRMIQGLKSDRRFCLVTLGPFSPPEHRRFVETLVGTADLAPDLPEKLYDATEGHPFFTKELVRSLVDSGAIGKDESGTWSLSGEAAITTDVLPSTIQQAVRNRIDRLPEAERAVLSTASVLGRSFDYRDLEALVDVDDVEEAVDRLVGEGILEEERESRGDRLGFSSGVVRDVLYAELPRRKRRSMHRQCGEQIEKRESGRLERVYADLLYHFSEADDPERTVEYGLKAARRSLESFSAEDAARAAGTALEFLDEGDPALEAEARLLLARALRMSGDIEGTLKQAEGAIRILEERAEPVRTAEALLLCAETAWQARRTEEMGRWLQRGMEVARSAGATDLLRQSLSLAATLANLRGESERANEYLQEVERLGVGEKAAEAQEEVPPGGRLVVAFSNPVASLEPADNEVFEDAEILTNVFETLLASDDGGNLVPWLCEKWDVLEEGRAFLLRLRDRVAFQDGHPLGAADVKRSFERGLRRARKTPAAYAAVEGAAEFKAGKAEEVAGLVVRSGREIEIRLSEPLPTYPALLTDVCVGIARESDEGRVVGTGPFRLKEHAPARVVLERNPSYWKGGRALLDAVEFRPGTSASDVAAGLRSGDIDLARDLHPQDLEKILRDRRFRRGLVEAPQKNIYFALFSRSGPASRDERVRRALCGVVRTHDLVWQTLGRFAQPATCLLPPGILGHDPGRRRRPMTSEEAMALLAGAGLATPIRLRASVHPVLQDRYGSLLNALFAAWSELGVEVSVETATMASFLRTWQENEGLDLLLSRWNPDYDDPDNFTHTLFHSVAGQLRSYFSAPEADQLVEQARAESRPAARELLYRRFEGLLADADALIPLFHDIDYRVANPRVRGLRLRSTPPYVNYAGLGRAETEPQEAETRGAAGGTIHVPVLGIIRTLEPANIFTKEDQEIGGTVFETLTRHVGGGKIGPALAAHFEPEEGGMRYRFRLRDNVRFHDGRRLTARDVRYSYERLLLHGDVLKVLSRIRGAQTLLNAERAELEGFRIHSATEFTIDLVTPIAFFPLLLSHPATGIVPEGSERFGQSWQEGCVGTGPFRVINFDPGRRLELERNPGYWRPGLPRSERLIFSCGVPPGDILTQFRSGGFSLCSDLFPDDVERLRRDPQFASGYRETPHLTIYYAAFNTKRGPLKDINIRRRLMRSVDVPALVRATLGRTAMPADGLIPPGLLGHRPAFGLSRRQERAAQSKAGGVELSAALHPLFQGKYSALHRGLEERFEEAGVRIARRTETMAEFLDATDKATVDMVIGRWGADYPDADTFTRGILHSEEGFLGRLCGSPEINALAEKGWAEPDPAVRHSLYRQIEEVVLRDALLLPLFHEQVYCFARPEVEGLFVSSLVPFVRYEELRVRE